MSEVSSDVSAVVPTLGEPTTGRALESLRAQTISVREVHVVRGETPFHRALNRGAAQVATPFFVQVDADMVLDADCVQVLRAAMTRDVGIAVGALRDPLMGTIAGVKLFRRECFGELELRDTVAPEVDFHTRLAERGWETRYLIGHQGGRAKELGDHRPDYSADYVFGTYHQLGTRYVRRGDPIALRWRFRRLRRSRHPMAPVARVAMADGMFGTETRDVPKPRPSPADSAFLRELATGCGSSEIAAGRARRLLRLGADALFEAFFDLGTATRDGSAGALRACLRVLAVADGASSLTAEAALGHGVLAHPGRAARGTVASALQVLGRPTGLVRAA
jgi:hypothetical protein